MQLIYASITKQGSFTLKHIDKEQRISVEPILTPKDNVVRFRRNFPQHNIEEMKKMLNVHPCEVAFKCLSGECETPLKEGCSYWKACNMHKDWLLG